MLKEEIPHGAPQLPARLARAYELQDAGQIHEATREAEAGLDELRQAATSEQVSVEHITDRIQFALALVDLYLDMNDAPRAAALLEPELAFIEETFSRIQADKEQTTLPPRMVVAARTQLRDRLAQVRLLDQPAPEIDVAVWLNKDTDDQTDNHATTTTGTTLADLRGRVVLIDFWATWCKPCGFAFPKLKTLHERFHERGLDIIALTRHYFAYRSTAASQADEVKLIENYVAQHALPFPVGICADEGTQNLYGATGLPTLILIDRRGRVRHAQSGGVDEKFDELLEQCLNESADYEQMSRS